MPAAVAAAQSAPSPAAEKSPAPTEADDRNNDGRNSDSRSTGSRKTGGQVSAVQANVGRASADQAGTDADTDEDVRWRPVLGLPCQLTVDLPLPDFRVRDFLSLRSGSVIATGWRLTRDVPLRVNGTLIGWGEFEGAGKRLGIRLTELA
jgi:flagellar motor switch/type III secretory pathway protein FliN